VSGKFYWSDPDYLQVGQGSDNETRVRMAFVALGGGPAFICDRLPELPEERLLLIPQCLPSYRQPARPIDLFTRDGYPQVWDLPVETAWGSWHVLGLFNLDEEPARAMVDLRQMRLDRSRRYAIWDYFGAKLLGEVAPGEELDLTLSVPVPATDVRVLRVTAVEDRPFVLATDMHLTQGGVELPEVQWDAGALTLRGVARRAPGLQGEVVVFVPEGYAPAEGELQGRLLRVPLQFATPEREWVVEFRREE
jgi:hypothetical protein